MEEKEMIQNWRKQIAESVKMSAKHPAEAVENLRKQQEQAAEMLGDTSSAFLHQAFEISQAIGDIHVRNKNIQEADKAYKQMEDYAIRLYKTDREKYDYERGFSCYRLASFYRAVMGCAQLMPTPKVLNDQQKKLFAAVEELYKKALAATMANAKKGVLRYVDLHALCLHELSVLYTAVGNYQYAVSSASDGIRLEKAIYEKLDDKAHSLRLAGRMNTLAGIYTFMKNFQLSMETLEDAVFVLEEHKEEDPVVFGLNLGRTSMSLGMAYNQVEAERAKAEETCLQGLKYITGANEKAKGSLINDVITANMMLGDFYRLRGQKEKAGTYYKWTYEKARELYQLTRKPYYENIMKKMLPYA